MREILFRGKSPDNGEWVYGVPVIAKDDIADKDIIVMVDNPNEIVPMEGLALFEQVDPETVGQYTGLTDKNGKKIFEGDIVRYYHHKKSFVPVTDIKPEEDHYGRDEESGLPLAYRTTKIIRYKGHVELHPIWGMTINLQNRCQWWRNLNYDDDSINSDRLEVIGNVHDGGAYEKPFFSGRIVHMPTPHGRLIDADALLRVIEENSYRLRGVTNSTENGMFLTGIRQAIDESPTIIEAEVSE